MKLLGSTEPDVRRAAAAELGWYGPKAKRSLPALHKALDDESPAVRIAAAAAIWEIDRQAGTVVPVLLELLQTGDRDVRAQAAYALGKIGPEARRGLPDLHRILDASRGLFRMTVAEAILRIDDGDDKAFGALLVALQDAAADVRCQAAYALSAAAAARREAITQALLPLDRDDDPRVQSAAKLTLGEWRASAVAAREVKSKAGTDKLQRLIEQLQSGDAAVRKEAAARLAWMGTDAGAALPAIERLIDDESAVVRATAAWALWEVGRRPAAAVNTLVPLLNERDESLATLAAYVLGSMRGDARPALPALRKKMAACDGMLRLHIAEAIGKIDPADRHAADVLTAALRDANPDVRSQAAFALSTIDVRQAGRVIPHLTSSLYDGDQQVSNAARLTLAGFLQSDRPGLPALTTYVLGTIGPDAAPLLPELRRMLDDSRGADRLQAAEAIARIDSSDEVAIYALTDALGDADAAMRRQAAFALSAAGAQHVGAAAGHLASSLHDEDESVRNAARLTLVGFLQSSRPGLASLTAYVLGRVGPEAAPMLPQIHRLLNDGTGLDRLQLAEAICRIDSADAGAVDILVAALSHSESHMRCQAAYALAGISSDHAERVTRRLTAALDDRDEQVRLAARSTLEALSHDATGQPGSSNSSTRRAHIARASIFKRAESPPRQSGLPADFDGPRIATALPSPPALPVLPEPPAETVAQPPAQTAPGFDGAVNGAVVDATLSAAHATSPPNLLPLDWELPRRADVTGPHASPLDPSVAHASPLLPHQDGASEYAYPTRASEDAYSTRASENAYPTRAIQDAYPVPGGSRPAIFQLNQPLVAYSQAIPFDEAGQRQPLPEDDPATAQEYRDARIAAGYAHGTIAYPIGAGRGWMSQAYYWEAAALCHRPLYFEEVNVERYGNSFGLLQPVVSAAHFFGTVPLMPYLMTVQPPHECTYTLGHYRPGSDIPFRYHRLPVRLDGVLVEAATIWGLALIIN